MSPLSSKVTGSRVYWRSGETAGYTAYILSFGRCPVQGANYYEPEGHADPKTNF